MSADNKEATLALGTQPVGKLLLQYALPGIVAMMASSLYNLADGAFIGHGVGALAISGVTLTSPLMNLSAAFGAAVGVGASTLMSLRLGQKQYSQAQHALGNMVMLNIIIGVVVGLGTLLFLDPILHFFGASDRTLPYARQYMQIILLGNVITHLYYGLNSALRAASKPRQAMMSTIATVLLNVVLDPIFIWPLHMGVRGAACATVLSQLIVLTWQLRAFSRRSELLHLQWRTLRLRWSLVRDILSIGISPFAMNVTSCVIVIFINHALVRYGNDLAVGAYGIANIIGFVFFMIIMGLNQGMQPIAGYNYGAHQMDRVERVLRITIGWGVGAMTLGFLIGQLGARYIVRLFTTDPALMDMAAHGIHINMAAFPVIGFQAVVTNFFQTIGKVKVSIFLSLSRQLIFLLPLLLALPPVMGLDGVWWSLPASDVVSAIVTFFILMHHKKKLAPQGD